MFIQVEKKDIRILIDVDQAWVTVADEKDNAIKMDLGLFEQALVAYRAVTECE